MYTKLRSLIHNRDGNFGLVTALCAVPLIGACGLALDYAVAYTKRIELQNVADAAVLHAASSGESLKPKLTLLAQKMFDTNATRQFDATPVIDSIDVDDDNHITLKASALVPLTLGRILQPNGVNVSVTSQAVMGSDDKIEVALVLDNTFSMSGQKLTDLKLASNALLTIFEKVDKKKDKVRISITPFARYVNVGIDKKGKSWLNVPADVTTTTPRKCEDKLVTTSKGQCTKETLWSQYDGVPYSYIKETCPNPVKEMRNVCSGGNSNTVTWHGCIGSRTTPLNVTDASPNKPYPGLIDTRCTNPITALTGDYKTLRAAITAMTVEQKDPYKETYIPQGVLWGWNTISRAEPYNEALDYDDDVKKFIIVMTDGTNTVRPQDKNYAQHTATNKLNMSDDFVEQTCSNAKAASADNPVTIYTVAVGIDAKSPTALALGRCATDAGKAFIAADSATLAKTFEEIALEIMKPRLTM